MIKPQDSDGLVETDMINDVQEYENERSWAYLPSELLGEIFSRLFAGDRVVFRSICKLWSSACSFMTTQKFQCQLDLAGIYPYLMLSGNRIFHPLYENCPNMASRNVLAVATTLSCPIFEKFRHMDFPHIPGAVVRAAKDGWLLITEHFYEISFFNLLTKERVQLLGLEGKPKCLYFSSPPTSTDWLVVVAVSTNSGNIATETIKSGHANRWSHCEFFMIGDHFKFSYCNPVVLEGLYYFLGKDAKLLIHDPCARRFSFHEAPEYIRGIASSGEQYMLLSDGKLLSVFVGHSGSCVYVCQWNVSKESWEPLGSLGDKMLFVSRPMSWCTTATIRGTGNKVYFPRLVGSNCLFYSLSTRKFHTFAVDSSYETFFGSKEYIRATWLPNSSRRTLAMIFVRVRLFVLYNY